MKYGRFNITNVVETRRSVAVSSNLTMTSGDTPSLALACLRLVLRKVRARTDIWNINFNNIY